ncbi:MAG: hypothetical protein WAX80_03010 [Minisyncoccia bacterium]
MSTFDEIKRIFFSGNQAFEGNYESINEIAFLVDENYLTMGKFPISTKREYLEIFEEHSLLNNETRYDAAGGGDNHMALKLLAQKYLKDERGLEAFYEQAFCGYYPDVISADKQIIVECGITANSEKILTYFQQGNIQELIQIPYPDVDDKEVVMGYSFVPNKELNNFLAFLQAEKYNKIKEILKNKRKSE